MVQNGLMIDVQLLGDATTANMTVYPEFFYDFINTFNDRPSSTWLINHHSIPLQQNEIAGTNVVQDEPKEYLPRIHHKFPWSLSTRFFHSGT
uniref:Uncharacterized protein n=1 Tax=Lepeophtheirus salmonis TaxID=72036 RepID=A0A0K2T780_LEPSM